MIVDDYYTKALLHFNGADGSTTITDETGKAWVAAGGAQIDTAQSVFGGASCLFDGSGDYVTTGDSDDWFLDDGSNANKWTIDFWARWAADPTTNIQGLIGHHVDNDNHWGLFLNNNTLLFRIRYGGTTVVAASQTFNPAGTTWYHIAMVKDGTNGYLTFVNGLQLGSAVIDTDPMLNLDRGNLRIGVYTGTTGTDYYFNGWIDEMRISKGVARWTTNFSTPAKEYAGRAFQNMSLVGA